MIVQLESTANLYTYQHQASIFFRSLTVLFLSWEVKLSTLNVPLGLRKIKLTVSLGAGHFKTCTYCHF